MAVRKASLIKRVLGAIPEGYFVDSKWLTTRGVSRQLLHQYVQSGWLERVKHGLVRKPSALEDKPDHTDWVTAVLSAQWMNYEVHVGGTTALELQGHAHYLRLGGKPRVYLHGTPPSWLKQLDLNAHLHFRKTTLFDQVTLGVNYGVGDAVTHSASRMIRSTPERAIFEALDELPKSEGFTVLDELFASLSGLRPRQLNNLLLSCQSVKVKRLFFVFADRHAHAWRKYLNVSDFDLGSGDRQFVEGGRLHPDYHITVPANFLLPHEEELDPRQR